jgi:transposase-like protein
LLNAVVSDREGEGSAKTNDNVSTVDAHTMQSSGDVSNSSAFEVDTVEADSPRQELSDAAILGEVERQGAGVITDDWTTVLSVADTETDSGGTLTAVAQPGADVGHMCEVCGECFDELSRLVDHQCERHGATRSHCCTHCGRAFVRLRALEQHERRHAQEKRYSCAECDMQFITNGELARHRRALHAAAFDEGPFRCEVCDKDLANARERAEHRAMHRNRVPCPECGKTFTLERSMRAHVATFHSDQEVPKPFECDICGHAFVRANLMAIHRRTHTGERPFQCEMCGRRFICRGDLNKHTRLHVDGYMYKCKICGKEIKTSRESADHRRMHTSGINCPVCGKSFTRYLNMQAHVRGTHDGERRFKCEVCGKAFVYAQNLRYHRRQHQSNVCKRCDKKFASPAELTQHRLEEHDDEEETKLEVSTPSAEYQLVYVFDNQVQFNGGLEDDR